MIVVSDLSNKYEIIYFHTFLNVIANAISYFTIILHMNIICDDAYVSYFLIYI